MIQVLQDKLQVQFCLFHPLFLVYILMGTIRSQPQIHLIWVIQRLEVCHTIRSQPPDSYLGHSLVVTPIPLTRSNRIQTMSPWPRSASFICMSTNPNQVNQDPNHVTMAQISQVWVPNMSCNQVNQEPNYVTSS